jgi:hypothetical protein
MACKCAHAGFEESGVSWVNIASEARRVLHLSSPILSAVRNCHAGVARLLSTDMSPPAW